MPYSRCPNCGSLSHLNVGDVVAWYRKYHPDLKVGDLVSGLCFNCWKAENSDMGRDHQHNPDPNANAANAARIVAESTKSEPAASADLEAAWQAWSSQIQKVDERGMALLRAAFEAGFDAGEVGALGR